MVKGRSAQLFHALVGTWTRHLCASSPTLYQLGHGTHNIHWHSILPWYDSTLSHGASLKFWFECMDLWSTCTQHYALVNIKKSDCQHLDSSLIYWKMFNPIQMSFKLNQRGIGWDSLLFNLTRSLSFMGRVPFSGHDLQILHKRRWGDMRTKGQPKWD